MEPFPSHAPENYICPFCLLARGSQNKYVYLVQSVIFHAEGKGVHAGRFCYGL